MTTHHNSECIKLYEEATAVTRLPTTKMEAAASWTSVMWRSGARHRGPPSGRSSQALAAPARENNARYLWDCLSSSVYWLLCLGIHVYADNVLIWSSKQPHSRRNRRSVRCIRSVLPLQPPVIKSSKFKCTLCCTKPVGWFHSVIFVRLVVWSEAEGVS